MPAKSCMLPSAPCSPHAPPPEKTQFYDRLIAILRTNPETYAANLEKHFTRHLLPFVRIN